MKIKFNGTVGGVSISHWPWAEMCAKNVEKGVASSMMM